jgi:hypothetical protein
MARPPPLRRPEATATRRAPQPRRRPIARLADAVRDDHRRGFAHRERNGFSKCHAGAQRDFAGFDFHDGAPDGHLRPVADRDTCPATSTPRLPTSTRRCLRPPPRPPTATPIRRLRHRPPRRSSRSTFSAPSTSRSSAARRRSAGMHGALRWQRRHSHHHLRRRWLVRRLHRPRHVFGLYACPALSRRDALVPLGSISIPAVESYWVDIITEGCL